jgi:hypothetical protein
MLVRGQYDQPGEKVEAAAPTALHPLPPDAPKNRLGLAQWLVDPANPLTARVIVNRYWQRYFGTGIVKTSEDFGAQGEWPTHPELLDWLALEFIRGGWDVKHIQRLIVTSAVYRQSSHATPEKRARDPQNRMIARAPRLRLEAEVIRDNALAVSGLLVRKIGGPSVKPYQPEGLWEEVAYGAEFSAQKFTRDEGENLYRRSMYTFWKRQAPPPTMLLFDAPNREICTVKRSRTNTPLQALALMNDPQFVEAARHLALRAIRETGGGVMQRVMHAFKLATAREPTPEECALLVGLYDRQLERYQADAEGAEQLLAVGESELDPAGCSPSELAALAAVASVILNLDETITRG